MSPADRRKPALANISDQPSVLLERQPLHSPWYPEKQGVILTPNPLLRINSIKVFSKLLMNATTIDINNIEINLTLF